MRQAWKCIDAADGSWDLTVGKLYYCNKYGQVVQDNLVIGSEPEAYNEHAKKYPAGIIPRFVKWQAQLENK